jgi:hypothetical protein
MCGLISSNRPSSSSWATSLLLHYRDRGAVVTGIDASAGMSAR